MNNISFLDCQFKNLAGGILGLFSFTEDEVWFVFTKEYGDWDLYTKFLNDYYLYNI